MKNVRIQQVTLTIAYDEQTLSDPDKWSWDWLIGTHKRAMRVLDIKSSPVREPTAEEHEIVGETA